MKWDLKAFLRQLLPRAVKKHRIWGGPEKGKLIHTSWHDYPAAILGYTERNLISWFTRNVKTGETWLDVGAHYGFTSIALAGLVGASGRVIAFEPLLTTAGYLNLTRQENQYKQLHIVPLALGNSPEITRLQLPAVRGMVDSTLSGPKLKEDILVCSLDWFWPIYSAGNPQVNGIKIDVQGMEVDTLAGMGEVLANFHPKLILEFHAGVDRSEVLALIETAGYNTRGTAIGAASSSKPLYGDDRSYLFVHNSQPQSGPVQE